MPGPLAPSTLLSRVTQLAQDFKLDALAISVYDYETRVAWSAEGDRWFHAASTIKLAVLVALFTAVEQGRFALDWRLHVRNRFLSLVDGLPFRVSPTRDADAEVHAAIGRTMRLCDLATHMITRSSNLATNLLLDLVGVEYARQVVAALGVEGIELVRGVEDDRAFEAGLNNRVTANGMVSLLRAIYERRNLSADASGQMLDILLQQELRSGISAGLPASVRSDARVGNKTGEISSAAHDVGVVFLGERQPYVLAILTEPEPETAASMEAVASVSRAVYDWLAGDASAGSAT